MYVEPLLETICHPSYTVDWEAKRLGEGPTLQITPGFPLEIVGVLKSPAYVALEDQAIGARTADYAFYSVW